MTHRHPVTPMIAAFLFVGALAASARAGDDEPSSCGSDIKDLEQRAIDAMNVLQLETGNACEGAYNALDGCRFEAYALSQQDWVRQCSLPSEEQINDYFELLRQCGEAFGQANLCAAQYTWDQSKGDPTDEELERICTITDQMIELACGNDGGGGQTQAELCKWAQELADAAGCYDELMSDVGLAETAACEATLPASAI